jgi:hypothetical protein
VNAAADDRAALVAELERLERAFRERAGSLPVTAWAWRPDARTWSAGEIVDHLGRTNAIYLAALEPALAKLRARAPRGAGPLAPRWAGRLFLTQLEPPPRYRVPAQRPLRPAPDVAPEAAWQAFSAAQRRTIELVRATAGLAPALVRFRNPVAFDLPVFDLAAGLLIIAAHERRHLHQLDRLRARPDFPAA